jgi:pimeloyl-ACP methyl ester carboxylesterase
MSGAWVDPAPHESKFVKVNNVRLNYLDWGGDGPTLILIHGVTTNPHTFDDLAPALTDRFRVIAYARRGHGRSQPKGPWDASTITEDLSGLLDALGIARAHLAGHSYGGCEITGMAVSHPDRVDRIIYLDAGYDWSDPAWKAAVRAPWPLDYSIPAESLTSIEAFLEYQKAGWDPRLVRAAFFEPYLRDELVVQSNGTVRPLWDPPRVDRAIQDMLGNPRRDYSRVRAPALAIYAKWFLDEESLPATARKTVHSWEQTYMAPFRVQSIDRIRRELRGVRVEILPTSHMGILVMTKQRVARLMRAFLGIPTTPLAAH